LGNYLKVCVTIRMNDENEQKGKPAALFLNNNGVWKEKTTDSFRPSSVETPLPQKIHPTFFHVKSGEFWVPLNSGEF